MVERKPCGYVICQLNIVCRHRALIGHPDGKSHRAAQREGPASWGDLLQCKVENLCDGDGHFIVIVFFDLVVARRGILVVEPISISSSSYFGRILYSGAAVIGSQAESNRQKYRLPGRYRNGRHKSSCPSSSGYPAWVVQY